MNHTSQPCCSVLYIDDEEKALKYFKMAFSSQFSILTASSGEEGLAILRRESGRIGVVVSDQRMPGMIGADLLARVREEFPRVVRILTTAYSDLPTAILAVNKGHIYQYMVKPWEIPDLEMVLHRAVDYHQVLSERDELLRLKMTTLQRILCCDRVKWLLLLFGAGNEPRAAAFRKALLSLVRSLAEFPAPKSVAEQGFTAAQFDAMSLITREFLAGVALQAGLNAAGGDHAIPANCSEISALGEPGPLLAASLGAFLATLSDGETATVHAGGDGVRVSLPEVPSRFFDRVSGVLFDAEADESSSRLLSTLWRFAEARIPFSIEVDGQNPIAINLPREETASPDAVIGALGKVFDRWDVASR